jgi:cystathionine beta-lyase
MDALSDEEIDRKIIHEAGLWLDSGSIFGESGKGFQRINAACPRSILQEALERLVKAFKSA